MTPQNATDAKETTSSKRGPTEEPRQVNEPNASVWLSVIGIGDDGLASIGEKAKRLIDACDVLIGGSRHHEMIADFQGERLTWRQPLIKTLEDIEANRGRNVVVLATGDPIWFGVGETLVRTFSAGRDAGSPRPLRLQPRLRAPRLAARRGRNAEPAQPANQRTPPPSHARGPGWSCSLMTARLPMSWQPS